MRNEVPEDDIIDTIGILIDELNAFFGEPMKEPVIEDLCVELTTGKYRSFTLDDIYLITREIKEADIYGKLTANKVLSFAKAYYQRRLDKAEKVSEDEHYSAKGKSGFNSVEKEQQMRKQDRQKQANAVGWYIQNMGETTPPESKK